MLVKIGVPTGIWPSVSTVPGGGLGVLPGRPPAPLMASEPAPLQGNPVIGLVPVTPAAEDVPGSVPGLIGDTGGSGICESVNELNGFCAITKGGAAAPTGARNAM